MRLGRRRQRPRSSATLASNGVSGSDGLRTWALSLPFVRESTDGEGDTSVRVLLVDCPPLHVNRAWLQMGMSQSDGEVLAFIHDDGDVFCVGLSTPSTTSDRRDLEAVLLSAYESAFAGCSP